MCRMMEEMRNESREEGREEGREEMVLKLLKKYPPEQVADMLELSLELVNEIYQNH